MSENKQQFETDTVTNDKSQGTVARHFRYCGISNVESALWKKFKISQVKTKLQASWLSRALCAPRHCPAKHKELPRNLEYGKKQLL